jgi:hypothetical protein
MQKRLLEQLNRERQGNLTVRFWDCRARKRTLAIIGGPIIRPDGSIPLLVVKLI